MDSLKHPSEGSIRRGRPRKEDRSELSAQRERNRQAQRLLKARRLHEQVEKDALISHLESTVDSLAAMHLDLIDELLRSEALHKNTQFTERLRDSIKTTLHLMKGSTIEKKPVDLANDVAIAANSLQPGPSPPLNVDVPSAEAAVESRHHEYTLTFEDRIPTVATADKERSRKRRRTKQTEQARLAPVSLPNNQPFQFIFKTFGNGWTGDLPKPYYRFQEFVGNNASSARDSLCLSIVEHTLHRAYAVLLHTVDPTDNSVMQIFGISLRRHSREELLFNLRWFLGPGYAHLNRLAGIIPDGAGSPAGDIPSLHPTVDADARSHAESSGLPPISGLPRFMTANDIVVYLSSMKARSIEADILELTVEDDHKIWISKSLFFEELSTISVCLTYRPAFQSEYLSRVIIASATWPSKEAK